MSGSVGAQWAPATLWLGGGGGWIRARLELVGGFYALAELFDDPVVGVALDDMLGSGINVLGCDCVTRRACTYRVVLVEVDRKSLNASEVGALADPFRQRQDDGEVEVDLPEAFIHLPEDSLVLCAGGVAVVFFGQRSLARGLRSLIREGSTYECVAAAARRASSSRVRSVMTCRSATNCVSMGLSAARKASKAVSQVARRILSIAISRSPVILGGLPRSRQAKPFPERPE